MREQQAGGLASDLLSELQALFVCGRGWGYCKGAQGGWEDPPAGRWTGCSSSWLPADSWAGCWSRSGPPADSWAGCWWSGGLPADSWVGSWLSQGGSGQLRILMRPTSKQLRGLMRIWGKPASRQLSRLLVDVATSRQLSGHILPGMWWPAGSSLCWCDTSRTNFTKAHPLGVSFWDLFRAVTCRCQGWVILSTEILCHFPQTFAYLKMVREHWRVFANMYPNFAWINFYPAALKGSGVLSYPERAGGRADKPR